MYKATLYFSDKDKSIRDAARSRVVEIGYDYGGFTNATITDTLGVWNENIEPGFTYTILNSIRPILETRIEQIAAILALEYDQQSVLIELEQVISAHLVSTDGSTCEVK